MVITGCQYHDSIQGYYSGVESTLHIDAQRPNRDCAQVTVVDQTGKSLDQFSLFLPRYDASNEGPGKFTIDTRGDECFTDQARYVIASIVNTQTNIETHTELRTYPAGPHGSVRYRYIKVQTTTEHQTLDLKDFGAELGEMRNQFTGAKDFKTVREY